MIALHLIYLGFLLFSLVMAILNLRWLGSRKLTLFFPYLLLLFIQEVWTFRILQGDSNASTAVIYNIYAPVNTSFFALFFYNIPFFQPAFKKIILVLLSVYLAAVILTFGFLHSLHTYNSYLNLAGSFVITLCAMFFLFNYFKLDNHSEEKKWLPVLWISIGLVTFFPVVNISFALYKQLQAIPYKLYQVIPQAMSIFLYGCFAWAFNLCRKKNWI